MTERKARWRIREAAGFRFIKAKWVRIDTFNKLQPKIDRAAAECAADVDNAKERKT